MREGEGKEKAEFKQAGVIQENEFKARIVVNLNF